MRRRVKHKVAAPSQYPWFYAGEESALEAAATSADEAALMVGEARADEFDSAAYEDEQTIQARLLHDIFGNPFRPVTLNPPRLTPKLMTLAQAIYLDRAFDMMPILADALEKTGCDNQDILSHCRGPGPHVKGCWVVDLVLGKE